MEYYEIFLGIIIGEINVVMWIENAIKDGIPIEVVYCIVAIAKSSDLSEGFLCKNDFNQRLNSALKE